MKRLLPDRALTPKERKERYRAKPEKRNLERSYGRVYRFNRRRELPDVERSAWYKAKYGITLSEYHEILAAQGGGCAICGITPEEVGRFLDIDHDHKTGVVRGILCSQCNVGLGCYLDNPELLRKATAYLEQS